MTDEQQTMAVVSRDAAVAMARRILPAFPQDCTKAQALELARVAIAYRLDPFLQEIIPYKGSPYITVEGRIRIANEHPAYEGYELVPVPDPVAEGLHITDGEIVWRCTVHRSDRKYPVIAYGRAGGARDRSAVSKTHPDEIASKRALHRALRMAFPVPSPATAMASTMADLSAPRHDSADGLWVQVEPDEPVTVTTGGITVDVTTGEVVGDEPEQADDDGIEDGEWESVPEPPAEPDPVEANDAPGAPESPQTNEQAVHEPDGDAMIDRSVVAEIERLGHAAGFTVQQLGEKARERYGVRGYAKLTYTQASDYLTWLLAMGPSQ
jgi:hypothetical protein